MRSPLIWHTDAPEKGASQEIDLLSTPSWTPSARLEPEKLVGSPNYGVSHPGHVTSNPPPEPGWAWPDLRASAARLHGSYCPKHSHADRIREKDGARQGLGKHGGCTSWKPRTPHVTASWLNWEREKWRERGGGRGSYNLFSVYDCISVRVIFFFNHVTSTESWSPVGPSKH